jgi:hypothetical protein
MTTNVSSNRTSARSSRLYRVFRQVHLWIGAWGALAAIMYGLTGFVLNHRGQLKLPQGASVELSNVEYAVPATARSSPEALRDWLREAHQVPVTGIRGQPGSRGRGPAGANWTLSGGNARTSWTADYAPGSETVRVRHNQRGSLGVLNTLHKAVGGGIAWILLGDSFALAMVLLGLTGIWMWARGRSPKQMVFSVLGAGVLVLLLVGGNAVSG